MTMRGAIRLILTAALFVAFWLRVHQLEQFPAGLHFDEAANGILSSEIAFEGYRPIFISSYTGKEAFFFYAAGLLMNRIGSSIFALRLTASFLGILTIAATYQLGGRLLRDRRIALIAAIFLAVNFSHLLFSRLGFRAIGQPLTQILTILFLLDGLRRLERDQAGHWSFGLAGLFLGLTAHTYLAARLFPIALVIPLAVLIYSWWKRKELWQLFRGLGLAGLVGIIILFPLLFWFFQNPEAFWVRIDQVGTSDGGISTVEGLRRAAAMLFWEGDPYIRFNIPGRPLFFPATVVVATLGVWQLLKQITRQASHAQFGRLVLLIAPIMMLLPTALATSEIVPSNLRAIGIFPFIVYWPAIGIVWLFDAAMEKLFRNTGGAVPSWGFVPLVIALLVGSAMNVRGDYFREWGTREDGFYETEGELRELASYLNSFEADRPIFVSTRFVPHPSLAFLADDYDMVTLIPESRALVYPSSQLPVYFFPASSPELNWMTKLAADRNSFTSRSGFSTFDSVAFSADLPQATQAVYGNFGFAVELNGIDFIPSDDGQSAILRVYSTVLGNPGFNMVPFVHVEDHMGNRWIQLEQPGYSPADWQTGDRFVQQFELPIPAGLPPVENYTIRLGWFDGDTGQEVTRFDRNGQFAGSAVLLEDLALTTKPSLPEMVNGAEPQLTLQTNLSPGLTLHGLDLLRREFNQGDLIDFALYWTADGPFPSMQLKTELMNGDDSVILDLVDPVGGTYPFAEWETPAFVIDRHQAQIPADLPAGRWHLQTVAVFPDGDQVDLFDPIELMIAPLDLILNPPEIETQLNAVFEDQIELVGYSYVEDSGELELVWRSTDLAADDYVAFIHLLNDNDTCCMWQSDRPLLSSATRPTSRWVTGEYVIDRYVLEEDDANLRLVAGLYRPENGIRLLTADGLDQVGLR